jgi:hypothetical protein
LSICLSFCAQDTYEGIGLRALGSGLGVAQFFPEPAEPVGQIAGVPLLQHGLEFLSSVTLWGELLDRM